MTTTPARHYVVSSHKTGKVITFEGEEVDVISSRGSLRNEAITAVGEPFSLYLAREIAEVTLAAPTVIDEYTAEIDSPVAPVAGNLLCLKEGSRFFQAEINTVSAPVGTVYTVSLDSPIDFAFSLAGGCSINSRSMNVNGAITPVSFIVSPSGLELGTRWDIHGFSVHIVDDAAMDDTKFGGLLPLVRGLLARSRNGVFKTLGNFKRNADFGLNGFTTYYREKSGGGQYSFSASLDLKRYGTSISTVVDDDPDYFEGIVQDDLSGLVEMRVAIHGHVEQA